ncbi:MAG: hypothetical protein IJF15_05700 [Oscillospiraceae bacterium]|nr:hypothetical protein [Oscillospiraceae bacterium]
MDSKKINMMWAASLMVIGVVTIMLAGSDIIGIKLPDVMVRVLCVIDLLVLPALVFSTVKKMKNRF